jgi:acyl dehydratase
MRFMSHGRTFNEFKVGEKMLFPLMTITEASLMIWAGLSGDFNPLHVNEEYAKTTFLGEKAGGKVPHGQFIASLAVTPVGQLLYGTAIAFLEMSFRFIRPFAIGDTLYIEVEVAEKKPTRKYPGGVVKFHTITRNQRGEQIIEGALSFLVSNENTLKVPRRLSKSVAKASICT